VEILGILLLGSLIIVSFGLAQYFGFSIARMSFSLLAVLVGGALGAIPGIIACFLDFGRGMARMSPGARSTSPNWVWPILLLLAGTAAGVVFGLFMTERVIYRIRSRSSVWWMTLAGFTLGTVASFLLLVLVQNTSWGEHVGMILSPLSLAAVTVAGYSVKAAKV
jgi:hypothetical protein